MEEKEKTKDKLETEDQNLRRKVKIRHEYKNTDKNWKRLEVNSEDALCYGARLKGNSERKMLVKLFFSALFSCECLHRMISPPL